MAERFEFGSDCESLSLPAEISARLRERGVRRVRVMIVPDDASERLEERGIAAGIVDTVAAVQNIPRDIALAMLAAEGSFA